MSSTDLFAVKHPVCFVMVVPLSSSPLGGRNSCGVGPQRETSCPLRSAPHYSPQHWLTLCYTDADGDGWSPPRVCRPDDPRRPKEQGTSKPANSMCSGVSLANVKGRRFFDNEEMRGRPGVASMRIALTLLLGPAIVFQLIAASLQRMALTDGQGICRGRGG